VTQLPSGWRVRFDAAARADQITFEPAGRGFHVVTGPAGVYYKTDTTTRRPFYARAVIVQEKTATQAAGYGLFIGGADLGAAGRRDTAFLIRQDGKFAVIRRAGNGTTPIVDWSEHAAIRKAGARAGQGGRPESGERSERGERFGQPGKPGTVRNALTIDCGASDVRFLVNGAEVASLPASEVDTDGVAGVRVGAGLDLRVSDFEVTSR